MPEAPLPGDDPNSFGTVPPSHNGRSGFNVAKEILAKFACRPGRRVADRPQLAEEDIILLPGLLYRRAHRLCIDPNLRLQV